MDTAVRSRSKTSRVRGVSAMGLIMSRGGLRVPRVPPQDLSSTTPGVSVATPGFPPRGTGVSATNLDGCGLEAVPDGTARGGSRPGKQG
jgi:hypothetical protein